MQFRGLTRLFTFALIVISLYQLHLTFVIRSHEQKIKQEAELQVKKDTSLHTEEARARAIKRTYAFLLSQSKETPVTYGLNGKVSYDKAKEQELNLGLDLQGGMNVTLDIRLSDMVRTMSNDPKDPILNKILALAESRKQSVGQDFGALFVTAFQEITGKKEGMLRYFSNYARRQSPAITNDAGIRAAIRKESEEALKRTYDILLTRIDQFGVAQPVLSLDQNKGIITVELAGNQEDPERIRKYLQATAKLQFWEMHTIQPLLPLLVQIERNLSTYLAEQHRPSVDKKEKKTIPQIDAPPSTEKKKTLRERLLHKQNVNTASKTDTVATETHNVFTQILAQLQNQINEAQKRGIPLDKLPFIFQMPVQDTATFYKYLNLPFVKNALPAYLTFLPNAPSRKSEEYVTWYAVRSNGEDPAKIEGDMVADAVQDFDERGQVAIRMMMTKLGEKTWADMTTANIGLPIAIALDDRVYSAPTVNTAITGGVSQITGGFTSREAQDLANILKSGKLPVSATIIQEQIVGPTLGKEAIIGGATSFIIAFVVIMLLMYLYYNTAGSIANIALILNLLFTIGMLTALGATLTAPGIAGLVLTIGMAVDTNVIIFERIKEELKSGMAYSDAIRIGYNRSLAPVLDAHVTTMLTAIILYNFGLGSIKGFATTQILGLLLSLLCGILVSRQISDFWTKRKRHFHYFTALSKSIFQHSKYKFVEFRKYTYMLSFIVLILGIASFFNGFDEGVEFKGGRSYTIRFQEAPPVEKLRDEMKSVLGGENPIIKTIGDAKTLNITTSYLIEEHSKQTDSIIENALYTALQKYLPEKLSFQEFSNNYKISSVTILPTISDDLKKGAVKATLFSLIAIFLYIFIRFRKWQYSLGTIIALFHDVLVTLIVFSFLRKIVPFPLEIDQHFIAAILTVIGFSMNDTVIVFDRVRETFKQAPPDVTNAEVINKAINDTLSRTVMTAFTVFLTILILFLFGGEVTQGFAFALLIGVAVGTYSSIFVAAPILVDFAQKKTFRRH